MNLYNFHAEQAQRWIVAFWLIFIVIMKFICEMKISAEAFEFNFWRSNNLK